jgi:hypothetical protein
LVIVAASASSSWTPVRAEPTAIGETLVVDFMAGQYAVTSQNEYSGQVTVVITGIGQASGTQFSDAFYLVSDYTGKPITPILSEGFTLAINGNSARFMLPGQQAPPYRGDHSYTLVVNAPGGKLTFGVMDVYTFDNAGSYIITIGGTSTCGVPFFSQRDARWFDHPLDTAGECSAYCGKIGTCGCTLTSAAMVFAYYGVNTQPDTLSDCMGTNACMFKFKNAADDCSGGLVSFVGAYSFSWGALEREVNQNRRPVLLGLRRLKNAVTQEYDTHYVVVLSGSGNNASGYVVHDPLQLNGANTSLAVQTKLGWELNVIRVYSGTPSCSLASSADDATADTPAALPFESTANARADVVALPVASLAGSEAITGTIAVYRLDVSAATIALSAVSSAGNVTEMQVWSDTYSGVEWQPFDTFAWTPWEAGDAIHARFRDGAGNTSDTVTVSLYPEASPPVEPYLIFTPLLVAQP